jgi:FdrA protein
MTVRVLLREGCYQDSARLMQVSRELSALPGIAEAVAMMGTPTNRALLSSAGFAGEALDRATPIDMLVALRGEGEAAIGAAREALDRLLAPPRAAEGEAGRAQAPSTVAEAVEAHPGANLVSVAVPGPYAAFVAHRALDAGRNVFLFSDNVPLEDEVALKRRAALLGLLVMGPDCGTAILSGVGLGFANRVERGPVGIVGASGTGIQELSCALDRAGVGVSHAIGTGSRDLSAAVDGVMTALALSMLAADEGTRCVVVVAKHPDEGVARRLHGRLATLGKPVVVRYLGDVPPPSEDGVFYARSLDEAADAAAARVRSGGAPGDPEGLSGTAFRPVGGPRREEVPVAGRLVGLFGGGSLAAEASFVLAAHGIATVVPSGKLSPGTPMPEGNLIVDTGDDLYTVGRPHPMVDQTVRCELIRAAGADPATGTLLLDLVLGDGAHPDPAPEIAAAVADARAARAARGGPFLGVIASVCGSRGDPQGTDRQERALVNAGIDVEPTAARAARAAAIRLGAARRGGR